MRVNNSTAIVQNQMPAQPKDVDGLLITVRGKRWWRRFIPFYTDFFKTSFWVDIERLGEVNLEHREIGTSLSLDARFPDGKFAKKILEIPESELLSIEIGGHIRRETEQILVAPTGQTQIIYGPSSSYEILFSYFVVSESAVMGSLFALLISLFILGGTLGGAVLGAWLQPDPVVIQQFALPSDDADIVLTPTPSLLSTPGMASPQPQTDDRPE